jgi:cell filamentation protein
MTDEPDFTVMGNARPNDTGHHSKQGGVIQEAADMLAYRLVELQCSPLRGGFNAPHLQNMHHYLYQDLYPGAGELRDVDKKELSANRLEQSLDEVFDRLASENYLRGLAPDEWTGRVARYAAEIEALQPFESGNGAAIREFVAELARKNQLNLQWDQSAETPDAETSAIILHQEQSTSLRRLIMLAMDRDPKPFPPTRGGSAERFSDRVLSLNR